jgi:hypothetical protein
MACAKLIAFCTPEEMREWLEELKETRDTAILLFVKSRAKGRVVKPGQPMPSLDDAWRIFVMPAAEAAVRVMDMEDVRARERGWVDVAPPVRKTANGKPLLLMAAIQGDDASSGTKFASREVKWLKRHLSESLHSPVEAVDVVTGGAETYRDIRFSDGAAAAHREGVEWRQFPKGNVVFRPAARPPE